MILSRFSTSQFFEKIAKSLGIRVRYVGEEPFSAVTGIYNQVMATELRPRGLAQRDPPARNPTASHQRLQGPGAD